MGRALLKTSPMYADASGVAVPMDVAGVASAGGRVLDLTITAMEVLTTIAGPTIVAIGGELGDPLQCAI